MYSFINKINGKQYISSAKYLYLRLKNIYQTENLIKFYIFLLLSTV